MAEWVKRLWLPPLAVAVLGMLVFAVTLGGTYVYDDVVIAKEDKRLINPQYWGTYWTKDFHWDVDAQDGAVDNLYRPLVGMSIALQVYLHGPGHPLPLHIVNVLMYGACCWLVGALGVRLGGKALGWGAGLLFAVHPVHSEVVCTIVGRAEMMAMIGMLGALLLHLGGPPSTRRALGILACLLLALLSKEQGMLLVGMLLAAEPLRRQLVGGEGKESLKLTAAGVCFITGVYVVLREQVLHLKFWWDRSFLDPAVQPMIWSTGSDRLLMPLVLFGRYVQQLLAPVWLSFDHSGRAIGWVVSKSDPFLYLGTVAAVAGVAALAVSAWRRSWAAFFLLASFALSYGVISNMVSLIGVNYAERLIFTPSVFFVLLVAMGLARLPRGLWVGVVGTLCVAGAIHSAVYASRWNDRTAFYAYTVKQQPKAMRPHQLLAIDLTAEGKLEAAAAVVAEGRSAMPEYWDIWIQSSLVAEKRGRWAEAEAYMTEAARLNPRAAATRLGLLRGRRAEAEKTATRPATQP